MVISVYSFLIAWFILTPVSFSLGKFFHAFVQTEDDALRGILQIGLGFAILSFSMVAFSHLGLLQPIWIFGLVALLFLLSIKDAKQFLAWVKSLQLMRVEKFISFESCVLWMRLIAIVGLYLATLSPEIGGDALCYHLNLPKVFLQNGSIAPFAYDANSFFPLFMNNLYLIGLAFGSVYLSKFFHFMCGLLLALLIERVIYSHSKSRSLSITLGLAFLITPGIYNQLSTTYVDVALAFFTTLALVVFISSIQGRHLKSFALAGFFAGCAFSIKYLSMMSLLGMGVIWIMHFILSQKRFFLLKGGFLFVLGSVISGSYWLVRNWFVKGNPFFPYFGEWFGEVQRKPQDYFDMGFGKDMFSMIAVFGNMFLSPGAFGAFSNRIGVLYVLLVPFLLIAAWKEKKSRDYGVFFTIFFLCWFFMVQADRWIYPLLPTMIVFASFGFVVVNNGARSAWLTSAGKAVFLGILGIYLLGGLYHYRYVYKFMISQTSSEYLYDMERTYPIAAWMNSNIPEDARVMIEGEPSKFYFDRDIVQNMVLEYESKYDEKEWSMSDFNDFLGSLGVKYVLLSDALSMPYEEKDTVLRQWSKSSFAKLLKEMTSANVRDAKHWYRVYEVQT